MKMVHLGMTQRKSQCLVKLHYATIPEDHYLIQQQINQILFYPTYSFLQTSQGDLSRFRPFSEIKSNCHLSASSQFPFSGFQAPHDHQSMSDPKHMLVPFQKENIQHISHIDSTTCSQDRVKPSGGYWSIDQSGNDWSKRNKPRSIN